MVSSDTEGNSLGDKGLRPKTIILWGRKDLLGYSIEFVLTSRDEWNVIRVSDLHSLNILLQKMEKVDPDIVIICDGDSASATRPLMQLLQKCSELKVITVNPENNSMDVYKKQTVWVKETSDLIAMVEA